MKKAILYLVVAFIAALSLTGCKKTEPAIENRLSPQEIMALPKIRGEGAQRSFFSSFTEPYEHAKEIGLNPAIVAAEVLSAKYYVDWNRKSEAEHKYTVYEIRITGVQEEYNAAGVKVGDIEHIIQDSYIEFAELEDRLAFFSEKTGKQIKDLDSRKEAESGIFELVPQKGIEYLHIIMDNEFPMQAGESYTMYITTKSGRPLTEVAGNSIGHCNYIYPMNSKRTLAELAKEYGFTYDSDIIAISEEIAKMFD